MRSLSLFLSFLLALLCAAPGLAHVTPNIELLKKGEFVRESLPGAAKYFAQKLALAPADLAAIRRATGWTPTEEDARIYIGRDQQGRPVGGVVLLWMPSEHGPVGVGVAFDPEGKIRRAEVTDVGSEPLAWVRPLLDSHGMSAFAGLAPGDAPDPGKVAPEVTGAMSRYYAKVIAAAVARSQALERVSRAAAK